MIRNERNARNGHVPLHQNLKLAGHWHGFWTFLLLIDAANFGGTWLTSFATAEKLVGVAKFLDFWIFFGQNNGHKLQPFFVCNSDG
jgi:hypothetical protein